MSLLDEISEFKTISKIDLVDLSAVIIKGIKGTECKLNKIIKEKNTISVYVIYNNSIVKFIKITSYNKRLTIKPNLNLLLFLNNKKLNKFIIKKEA